MTHLSTRSASPRLVWQLEQQGLHPLLARLYAARGIQDAAELDYALERLLPPASLTHASDAAALLADAIEAGGPVRRRGCRAGAGGIPPRAGARRRSRRRRRGCPS